MISKLKQKYTYCNDSFTHAKVIIKLKQKH